MQAPANGPRGPQSLYLAGALEPRNRQDSDQQSRGSSYGSSSRSSSGSSYGPGPGPEAAFNPDIDRAVLKSLNTTPQLSSASRRAEHYDDLVDVVVYRAAYIAESTVSRAESYLDSPRAANERIALLDSDVNGARTLSQLDGSLRRLSAIMQAINNPALMMSCMFLRQRIESRMDRLDSLDSRDALEAASPAASAESGQQAPQTNPFPEFASLMQHPAQKTRVDTYAEAGDWAARYGQQVLRASYLTPANEPDKAFVLGVTDITGSFSKLRNYRDASGNVGKMRVVHMHPQLRANPNRPVKPTPKQDLEAELAALKKARSPLMFERVYSVLSGNRHPVLKLYIPLPDFGIDAFYFCGNDNMRSANTRHAAAAMRALMSWTVEPLRHLHRDEPGQGPQVHFDVKPENMLVRQPGSDPTSPKVNLIDFGLAGSQKRLDSGDFIGTRSFMAPEYHARQDWDANAEVWPLSPKVDVWSLAMATQQIFFTGLTMRLPQQNDAVESRLHAHYGLVQERWQLKQSGENLRRAQRAELGRTMPSEETDPNSAEAKVYADYEQDYVNNLDKMQHELRQADPAMGAWFFSRFFRVDPKQRFTSEQLATALAELEPLFGSAQADRNAAIAYFDCLYPQAQQALRAEQNAHASAAAATEGPDLAQLHALPALPPRV